MTKESIKEDLKQLQNVIQKFVNKYDEPIQLIYDSNKNVSVSIKIKV